MSIRNAKREELRRLESKTLDAQFKVAVQEGLNCSPFEAEAVLGVVREVYSAFMEPSGDRSSTSSFCSARMPDSIV